MPRPRTTAVRLSAATALVAAPLLVGLSEPAHAADPAAQVRIVHGIPGTPVDVYVDGTRALDDFAPGTITDALPLTAGAHTVSVFPATAPDASGTPVIGPVTLTVPTTGNVSVVAHLTATGTPTLTPYVNDTSSAGAGKGRLVVRHDAAAPAVDVLVGGKPALTGLTNPGEKSADLPAGTLSASVAAAGTTTPVLGPTDVPVVAGRGTIVYAVGTLSKDLGVLVQTVDLTGGSPGGVAAGTGGRFADGGVPTSVVALTGLGVAVAAAGGLALAGSRSRA